MNDLESLINKIKLKQFYNPNNLVKEEFLYMANKNPNLYIQPVLKAYNSHSNAYVGLDLARDIIYGYYKRQK